MMHPKNFVDALASVGIDSFMGVPDSLLKNLCTYLSENLKYGKHTIAANEGNAIAMAAGYQISTGKCAAVYLQNSGLGNAINPLVSLADSEVYRIPILLIVGWRGEIGVKDEPQHVKQGRIMESQLELLEIPYKVIDENTDPYKIVEWANNQLILTSAPVALLVKKGTFSDYKASIQRPDRPFLRREVVLNELLNLAGDASIISTTGLTSREIFELRVARSESQRDLLVVGGMGHTASIALGAAIGQPNKLLVCIDGDGSVLMHMGALPIIGSLGPSNFIHILLNNAAHESVGGQPTVGDRVDFVSIAIASGYRQCYRVSNLDDLNSAWTEFLIKGGPVMLEILISEGSRGNLGRPTSSPIENKRAFMNWIAK